MLNFEELTESRRSLHSLCLLHEPSLLRLQSGVSFKLLPTDPELSDDRVRHLTTTATCLSSLLLDCPSRFQTSEYKRVSELASVFPEKALARTFKEWISEGSAGVYCRCRALPMVIASSKSFDDKIKQHVAAILTQLRKRPERFGIGEAGSPLKVEQWYPPNAFHTFWTIEILDQIERRYKDEYHRLDKDLGLKGRRDGMLLWGRQTLGSQLGLHSASPQSSALDSDQLAWALAIFLRFDESLTVDLENRDLIKQALKCLFSTQTDGTWRHYKPLFHYKKAGNAYCYVFETFAVLLQGALQISDKAEMIRELFKPYFKNLMDLWRYADSTKIDLRQYYDSKTMSPLSARKEYGWCSGHRTNVTQPESWASASVFSYAQALRRLIGIWCNEEALAIRKTPRTRYTRTRAEEEIVDRGKTWGEDKPPVSEQLWTMFINPVQMHESTEKLEPDSQPIHKNQARSAILFGPPGTSKTTLVRRLADVIGWEYVEIHASHFVAEGLPDVQKTADKIFKQLQELDHVVVLFDEIDELVREREMEEDAFGRFLTTSMLPKLAELWEARKILYFVATNHINYFDNAIIRSHRFDALILVSPPSFGAKAAEVIRLLGSVYGLNSVSFTVSEREIQNELDGLGKTAPKSEKEDASEREATLRVWGEQELKIEFTLAKFALLRWDELAELGYHLADVIRTSRSNAVSAEMLREALRNIADSQWRKNKSYADYLRDQKSERRDYQMLKAWEVHKESADVSAPEISTLNGQRWLTKAVNSLRDIKISGHELALEPPGSVKIRVRV
jgi:hypothetical protein